MKLVVSGSRHIRDYALFNKVVEDSGFLLTRKGIECIIQGGATGVDALAKRYAEENDIPVVTMPANWDEHGKAAGPIRNSEMIDYALEALDEGEKAGLLSMWDGISKGTWDCIKKSQAKGLVIYVHMFNVLDAAKMRSEAEGRRKVFR